MTAHEFIDKTGASDDEFQARIAAFAESAERRVGRCPVCTGDFALRKNGTLWTHNGDKWDGIWRLRCKGSGGAPR